MVMTNRSVIGYVQIHKLPVFEPNDYFWKNHWNKAKEQQWEPFANAVRNIISEAGGFGLSEGTMEAKMEYKALVNGKTEIKDNV